MGWWMLAVSFSIAAQSNNFKFQKVQLEVNGTPYNTIGAITQDKEGYIWISIKEEGLVRYDGYESKRYQYNSKDSTSIGHDRVEALYVEETGTLWVATIVGLSRYDASCDCFSQYRFQPNNDMEYGKGGIRAIIEDREHNLWVAMQAGGLFRYDRAKDKFIPYLNNPTAPNSLLNDYVYVILADREHNIWIGTGNPKAKDISKGGLIRFNPSTGASKRFVHDPNNPNSLSANIITALLEDKAGQIWVGTSENGLHQYNADSEDFNRIKVDTANTTYLQPPFPRKETEGYVPITILNQDQQGGYWIGTGGIGLNHFDPTTRKLTFYDLSGSASNENRPFVFYEDRQGQLWIGYLKQGGLYKLDPYARKFNIYPALKTMERSCESQLNPGSFWISTRVDGLHFLDGNTGKKTSFLHDEQDATSIGSNRVRAVYEDKEGTVWVGLGGGGLYDEEGGKGGLDKMDRQTRSFQNYAMKLNDTIDFNSTVFTIEEDQEGFLWLDVGAGLIRFDKEKEISKRYKLPNEDTDTRIVMVNHYNQFFGVLDFHKKDLYKYDIEKDSFIIFLKGYGVNHVLEDNQGGFWLGTWNQGLVYFNPMEDTLKQYTEEDGLLNDIIRGLLPGENGNYWVATSKGLVKFDSKNEKFISEGFPKEDFSISGIKSRDGQLFFGSKEGIYAFYPNQVNGNPFPPNVLIHSLQISGEPFNLDQAESGKINLSYRQNDFNFQYKAIHNSNPAENKYQYRLLPFDENWIDAGTQRRVQYTNLNPGNYTFQVKAANSDGVWNEKPATLSFHIATPWWTRWWAKIVYMLAFLGALMGIRQLEKRKLEAQQRKIATQQRINKITSKFVPTAFLNSLGRKDIMEVQLGDAIELEVTVLFVDIRAYTTLSEGMTPEENFRFVTAFNKRMGPIIQKNGGFVNQYLGDGIMALFKTSPNDALKAAIQMQQALKEYNLYRKSNNRQPIKMGIGFHTGLLIMGIIGDDQRMDAATISDAVNTASRIESLTKYFKANILLSEESLRQVQSSQLEEETPFYVRYLGKVKLKGKREPIGIYECFNGDNPAIIAKKIDSQILFKKGMDYYLDKQFQKAVNTFEKILTINPNDLTAQLFYNKAQKYLSEGTPEDWTGVEVMTFK